MARTKKDVVSGEYTSPDLSGVNLSVANFRKTALNYANLVGRGQFGRSQPLQW
ncbi:pentapeptide repeat-containing protein [Vasconcelosia minhoensis]|uniref:pentapeptide repeat-containing protein n=1 Tax=Vasconcelosia minhoensis TaxID=3366354 RepID=UPI0036F1A3AD